MSPSNWTVPFASACPENEPSAFISRTVTVAPGSIGTDSPATTTTDADSFWPSERPTTTGDPARAFSRVSALARDRWIVVGEIGIREHRHHATSEAAAAINSVD